MSITCKTSLSPLGRYTKLGRLFQVDKVDVHGTCDVSLKPGANGEVEVNMIDMCEVMEQDEVFGVLKLAEQLDLTQEEQLC